MKNQILISLFLLNVFVSFSQGWILSVPMKLRGEINSEEKEVSSIFYRDSSVLYFTRQTDVTNSGSIVNQSILRSKIDENGVWGKPEKVKELNNKQNNSVIGFSGDGNTVYLLDSYGSKNQPVRGIALAKKIGEIWSEPQHLPIEGLNIEGDFYGVFVNQTENVIVLSYNGPFSKGEEDLYACFKQDNLWSAPVHLGNTINSAGYEISPFLSKNLDTLFYASNGLGGFGDADIFYSIRKDDTWSNWTVPKNLGDKINSSSYDAFFSVVGKRVFWTSNRDKKGNDDIYFIQKILPPKLNVNIDTKDVTYIHGSDGKANLTVTGGVEPYSFLWSNGSTNEDLVGVPDGEYTVVVTDAVDQEMTYKAIIQTPKIKTGLDLAKIIYPSIVTYFDLGSWDIRSDEAKELDRIVEIMNEYPSVVIELGSHTDCRSDAIFNLQLSQNRAAATAGYIKQRISNPTRVYGKGYGESRLITKCPCEGKVESTCSEDEHQKNRRTEFLVKSNDAFKIPMEDNVTPQISPIKK